MRTSLFLDFSIFVVKKLIFLLWKIKSPVIIIPDFYHFDKMPEKTYFPKHRLLLEYKYEAI